MAGNMRRRVLVLWRLFEQETDEQHTLTMPEILAALERRGILADRRAIYEDIEELNNMGYEIIRESDGKRGYFLACRLFEDPEINMIAAAICSARFLTEQKTMCILGKLEKLASPKYRGKLTRRIDRIRTSKGENNSVLYYVDQLSSAIDAHRAVSFYYYRLNYRKRREFLNDGQLFALYPERLLWHEENYYLIAATEAGVHCHFRLDRMSELRVLEPAGDERKLCSAEEVEKYMRSTFELDGGRAATVTLWCEKDCADEIFERFGMNTIVYAVTETHFKADVFTAPGMQFYTWVFSQNGKVRILKPEYVRAEIQALCERYYLEYKE